jgi:CubicO group peptidase (beta-lactamase class C family)
MRVAALALIGLALGCASAGAQAPPPPPAAEPLPGLEALVDAAAAEHLARTATPGLAVAVVMDGETLLAKGYGVADAAAGRPVDGERTPFRIGSITKIFTAVAAMQLVEQGALSLDADVNDAIDAFAVPATSPEPVTLRALLTHTSGFEESRPCGGAPAARPDRAVEPRRLVVLSRAQVQRAR